MNPDYSTITENSLPWTIENCVKLKKGRTNLYSTVNLTLKPPNNYIINETNQLKNSSGKLPFPNCFLLIWPTFNKIRGKTLNCNHNTIKENLYHFHFLIKIVIYVCSSERILYVFSHLIRNKWNYHEVSLDINGELFFVCFFLMINDDIIIFIIHMNQEPTSFGFN